MDKPQDTPELEAPPSDPQTRARRRILASPSPLRNACQPSSSAAASCSSQETSRSPSPMDHAAPQSSLGAMATRRGESPSRRASESRPHMIGVCRLASKWLRAGAPCHCRAHVHGFHIIGSTHIARAATHNLLPGVRHGLAILRNRVGALLDAWSGGLKPIGLRGPWRYPLADGGKGASRTITNPQPEDLRRTPEVDKTPQVRNGGARARCPTP